MKEFCLICLLTGLLIVNTFAGPQDFTKTGYIDVENGKLYYEISGSGAETIVFIHDGMVHGVVWDGQFSKFSEKYRVVRYDRRGYGRSSMAEKKFSNIEDLNAVFTNLNINKAIIIGMSAGGGLAIDFTVRYPEKTSAMILVGAVVGGFSYSEHFLTRGGRLDAADYADPDRLLKYFVLEDPYEIAPQNTELKEKLWKIMEVNPQNMDFTRNRLAEIPERKAIDALNEIKIPVLIIAGEYDIPDVFAHAGAIEAGIANAQKVIIQNAGHLVPFEQPEEFNKQVLNFLNGAEFFQVLNTKGVTDAVDLFNKKREQDNTWIPFGEVKMNILGYQHLQAGKTKEAIELFKMNVAAYPESANTYDSLGEAYMIDGDKELAIENYKRSLELDPKNQNAAEKLKDLQ